MIIVWLLKLFFVLFQVVMILPFLFEMFFFLLWVCEEFRCFQRSMFQEHVECAWQAPDFFL